MIKKKISGAGVYSPWYTKDFVNEKIEEKKNALARVDSSGGIQATEGWNEKQRRRFEIHFERLGEESKKAYQSAARNFAKYLGLSKSEAKVSGVVARLILLSYMEASTLVEEYIMWMEEELELSPNTINVRLAALRWFVDAARRVGWVDWKLDVKNVKGGKVRDTKGPSEAEFRRIIRVVNSMSGPIGARTKAIVYMLAFVGARVSSVVSLDMENISFENKSVKVKWKGKGDDPSRYVWRPMGDLALEALEDWIEVRGSHPGPVFVRMDRASEKPDKRISIRSVQKKIGEVGREAATVKPLTTHGFRHFFATSGLENFDTRKVMKATGHTNIKTIEFYDDSDDKAAREVIGDFESRWVENLEDFEDDDEAEIQERYLDDDDDEELDLEDLGVASASSVASNAVSYSRISTGMDSVDFLLGGDGKKKGIVRGSLVLLGGGRGLGKSTLARQISKNICNSNPGIRVLYASAEETKEQIAEALTRLNCLHKNLLLIGERSMNRICYVADKVNASVVIVDSVSTVSVEGVNKRPGSITQVKAAGQFMLDWCKGVDGNGGSEAAMILIAHVTSSGEIAGPTELEHHVDAIYNFMSPSKRSKYRTLSCEGKNRFGDSTREIKFEMTDKGLKELTTIKDGKMVQTKYSVFDEEYDEVEDDYSIEGGSDFG